MNETANRELGQAPVGKLMARFAIPCIMSLLVSALYNIVDQIFVGRGVGYLGNGATNVVFPVTVITLAFALAIGDSCAAFLSLCQGQQDTENAHHSVGNAVALTVLVSLLLRSLRSVGMAVWRPSALPRPTGPMRWNISPTCCPVFPFICLAQP